jgi:hypothetical protein
MKVIYKYDTDLLTSGEEYDVVSINTYNVSINDISNGRFYMIEVKSDDGENRFFRVDDFENDKILIRDIKLSILNEDKIINKVPKQMRLEDKKL